MAKFCQECGRPVPDGAKFCTECGAPLPDVEPKQPVWHKPPSQDRKTDKPQPPLSNGNAEEKPAEPASVFCPKCGAKLAPGTKFCGKCGATVPPPAAKAPEAAQKPAAPEPQSASAVCPKCGEPLNSGAIFCGKCGAVLKKNERPDGGKQSKQKTQPKNQQTGPEQKAQPAAVSPERQSGGARAGEIDLGDSVISGGGAAVLSPAKGTLHGVGSYFGGIANTFKKPRLLIGIVIVTVIWIVVSLNRNSDSGIIKFLSFLTFAEGGYRRSFIGTFLGVFGRGTVAAALVSLFGGGFKNLIKGFGVLFKGRGEKRSVGAVIIGVVAGAALYLAYAGIHAAALSAMAGISGAILALQALGSGSGRLYGLFRSLTSKNSGGVRTASIGRCDGLLTGMTAGFAAATALSAIISSII